MAVSTQAAIPKSHTFDGTLSAPRKLNSALGLTTDGHSRRKNAPANERFSELYTRHWCVRSMRPMRISNSLALH
jgi:hypothetical protein